MFQNSLPWTWLLWDMVDKGSVYFRGHWQLQTWDKILCHAPIRLKGTIAACMVSSWKHTCSQLVWQGRARYTRNSLLQENVFWSFLFKQPPTLRLGSKGVWMAKKGIYSISHLLDSKGVFVSFYVARTRFSMGMQFKINWIELCTYVFRLQVPPTTNLLQRF